MSKEIKETDRQIKENLRKVLKREGKVTTKKLARELEKEAVGGKHYLKQRLHIHREWLPQEIDGLETLVEDDNTGGDKTRYWRLRKDG